MLRKMSFKMGKIVLISTIFLHLLLGTAFGGKGIVVYKKSGCDYFIVETIMGYALLEWYGGSDPDEGDIIIGNFESFGFKDIYNLTADSELSVWVEDYWLSWKDVIKLYIEYCY